MKLPICPFCGSEEIQNSVLGFYCEECETDFNEADLCPEDDYFADSPRQNAIDSYEEKIWDYITNSAKRKFDYETYQKNFPEYVPTYKKDNILWEIIMRSAAGQDVIEINSHISSNLAMSGLMFPKKDFQDFIIERQKDFGIEIMATKIATDSLNFGSPAEVVIGQVNKLLR